MRGAGLRDRDLARPGLLLRERLFVRGGDRDRDRDRGRLWERDLLL